MKNYKDYTFLHNGYEEAKRYLAKIDVGNPAIFIKEKSIYEKFKDLYIQFINMYDLKCQGIKIDEDIYRTLVEDLDLLEKDIEHYSDAYLEVWCGKNLILTSKQSYLECLKKYRHKFTTGDISEEFYKKDSEKSKKAILEFWDKYPKGLIIITNGSNCLIQYRNF